jgi:hypothetical protein
MGGAIGLQGTCDHDAIDGCSRCVLTLCYSEVYIPDVGGIHAPCARAVRGSRGSSSACASERVLTVGLRRAPDTGQPRQPARELFAVVDAQQSTTDPDMRGAPPAHRHLVMKHAQPRT